MMAVTKAIPEGIMNCNICGGRQIEKLFSIEGKRYAPGTLFDMVCCKECNLVFLNLIPGKDFFTTYYPDDYKPHNPDSMKPSGLRKRMMRSVRQFAFSSEDEHGAGFIRRVISRLYNKTAYRSLPPSLRNGNLLDIGCGVGPYLLTTRDMDWQVYGVEVNETAARYARRRGLQVTQGNFEAIEFPENCFDVITLWHVFEHFPFPVRVLSKIKKMLKEDGLLLLGIPNFNSMDRKLFRSSWNGYEVPLHLNHFTPHTIRLALEQTGFSCRRITHTIRPSDMASSIENLIQDKFHLKRNRFLRQFLVILALPLSLVISIMRRSSIIVVHAKKSE